ncbi:hypothetical protein [Sabulicella rubraurantiaca]|uniref:hypothetical protein n=1 Tax=Sabulicella rubraurantiaca TaxID=2811429 RepID=UPI001A976080|nr:hypothetical protein [Sabulicella rubraurantiaca]
MLLHDQRGLPIIAAGPEAVRRLDAAVEALLAHRPDAARRVEQALAADPDLLLGHTLYGFLLALLAREELEGEIACSLAGARHAAARRGATERERLHLAALAAWCERGEMEEAAALLERAALLAPLDAMAVKLAHALRFMLGDAVAIERVLPAWGAGVPGRGFLLGCHAFALSETGEPREAERAGRCAVGAEPADLWALHAVGHVMEAEGRAREGIGWLAQACRAEGSFARHLFWHRALFHLHLGEGDAALAFYDARVRDEPSEEWRDVANAVSLLWRLEAQGVEVGAERWRELADLAERRVGDHSLVFADLHHVLSLAAAGRYGALARFLAGMRARACLSSGTQPRLLLRLGLPAAEAVAASRALPAGCAAGALRDLAPRLVALGGSAAQRDLFERLALEDLAAAGRMAEVATRLAARARRRSPGRWEARLLLRARRAARTPLPTETPT